MDGFSAFMRSLKGADGKSRVDLVLSCVVRTRRCFPLLLPTRHNRLACWQHTVAWRHARDVTGATAVLLPAATGLRQLALGRC